MIFDSILGTIGNTPMVRLSKLVPLGYAEVYCKLESFNPMSSVKDRVGLAMIEDAERRGVLRPGMRVVEPTSGNTGIGLAMVCAAKGYRITIVMPDNMSLERRRLMRALGAELKLTPGAEGMRGAIAEAERILDADDRAFMPQQFRNPANPDIHLRTTGREIIEDLPDLDAFVAGVGTGGTVTGIARALKSVNPAVRVVAVEPEGSAVLSGEDPGRHVIEGIGAGFVPDILDMDVVDGIERVSDEEAKLMARELARGEGILAGISSGAALVAGLRVAASLGKGKKVVVLLPDSGERYLSTGLFEE
jgi:cysteine synthase A